jgi:subtilisin family serine protease
LPLSFFSSAGPTRDGREKPDVSAPGHEVLAAKSRTGTGVVRKSGTSMAAPATAGLVALVLAEARARGLNLTIDQTRKVVIDAARRNPPPGTKWHERYGIGRVSATAAVQAVIQMAAGGGGGVVRGGQKKAAVQAVPQLAAGAGGGTAVRRRQKKAAGGKK